MNYIRKFKKNSKALSPVVASIILIAVTVAVSVVVAAWMGGMTIGLMGSSEQVSVSAQATDATHITISARNSGASTVTISTAGTLDATAIVINPLGANMTISKGQSAVFNTTLTTAMIDGAQYTLKMSTSKGNTLTSTITYSAP